jgi:hypothetical protein
MYLEGNLVVTGEFIVSFFGDVFCYQFSMFEPLAEYCVQSCMAHHTTQIIHGLPNLL